ncbi:di-trans,poly-cis-decaprenylcistransferase [Allofranklinella schreckenbergeri]|uniref:Isoprenyl transferase n=1 Tax=Allofranklinella schreckenbergeri TaxID=1076744 RepID=A0A3M6PZH5_9BURK|nr:polyprenyl diphosphate synthase [Allofranklinella schreckenbergeri]RMW95468.1 di-trans,poly-cis-decaprenylcistransferase [Allofranklinella schreckenbergeri]
MGSNALAPLPHHVAIVMDGNGRWAQKRLLPRLAGHKKGVEALRRCVQLCGERGVRVLTVFAFSSENWRRPPEEVSGLMGLMLSALAREVSGLKAHGVRLHCVGERAPLAEKVRQGLEQAERETAGNDGLILNVCFNYGGRWDIAQAAERARQQSPHAPITEQTLAAHTALAHVPDPDLLIRTGGERRISNFLLWQLAYAELYFSDTLWPDFDAADLDAALRDYAQRQRRFGKTGEQVTGQVKRQDKGQDARGAEPGELPC